MRILTSGDGEWSYQSDGGRSGRCVLTSLYTFRMIFIVFHGKERIHAHAVKGVTSQPAADCAADPSTFVGALILAAAGRASANDGTGTRRRVAASWKYPLAWSRWSATLLAAWLWLGKRPLVTSIADSAPGRLLVPGGATPGALTGCSTKCS
ncbi:hypothetical protein ACNKHL_14120 [Shigella flexneri]